jgi:ADP-heptose:LPS heptosyltransferase
MKALQRADKILGPLACAALQPLRWGRRGGANHARRARQPSPGPEKVLLIKFWGIGSLQLLTPAVKSLRRCLGSSPGEPPAELVLLTLASNATFAKELGARELGVFDRVIALDVASAGWLTVFARILRLVRELRRERFDRVYDFEFFTHFSAVVALLCGARESHGFEAPSVWRGGFHTHVAPFNRYWHVARNFRQLAGGEDGCNVAATDISPARFSAAEAERVRRILAEAGVAGPYAVLNPNAGELSLERRWPRPHFAELARRLRTEQDLSVVLVGSASEREYTAHLAQLCADEVRPLNLAGELATGELASLLVHCAVFVSNDSGPMHLAAALGAPTVGLFGPETPMMYAPLGLRTRALYRPPACSPCINVHDNKVASCIYGFPQCLVNISVDDVLEAASAFVRGEELRELELAPRPAERPAPAPRGVPASSGRESD